MAWYAKFAGIDGSSKHKDHDKWCIVSSLNLGAHKAGGGDTGVARVGGKIHMDDASVVLISDKAMPKLKEATCKGKVFKKVEIDGAATYGDAGEQIYLHIELENVQITSYQLGVVDRDSATHELLLSLNYEKITESYTEYGKDGAKGGVVEFAWKVEEAEA